MIFFKGALISQLKQNRNMQLTIIIILVFFNLYQSQQKECICECCLDDNINCIPTFRSSININPLLECNDVTCSQQSCLTFSQCSIAFGYFIIFLILSWIEFFFFNVERLSHPAKMFKIFHHRLQKQHSDIFLLLCY